MYVALAEALDAALLTAAGASRASERRCGIDVLPVPQKREGPVVGRAS
ncbi:MAG: hypothetical protein K2X91_16850 [Thermoleophilia bacterium]|nr:hypothetical protein [Thermoleophilia bacterium]